MKKILLLILFSIPVTLFGQDNVKTINGPEYEEISGTHVVKIIGEDKDGVYLLRANDRDEYYIEKYSSQLTLDKSSKLILPLYDGKPQDYTDIIAFNNKFYLFTSYYNKDKAQDILNISTVNIATGTVSETKQYTLM